MGDKPRITLDSGTQAVIREDGWSSLLSGFGTRRDPSESTNISASPRLTRNAVEEVYRADGIGRRIVDLPAEEMTRKWVTVEGQNHKRRQVELNDLDARQKFARALRWAGLYGGAVMVMLIRDGSADLAEPLNEGAIQGVDDLIVYDRHQVTWTEQDISNDPRSVYFGRAERMTIQPIAGMPYIVHRSRVLMFDGEDVPDRMRQQNNGWGDSRLQPVYRALGRYAESLGGTSQIIRDFVTPVLAMKNLSDLIASGQENLVRKRLEILGVSQSMLNLRLIDADSEVYTKHASSVSGIDKLLQELKNNLSACTGIPQTRLFGKSADGMNATGEGDARDFYDAIASEQQDKLMPNVRQLVYLLDLANDGEPADRDVKANPLWQLDGAELSTTRKTNTEAATMAVDYGLIDDETAQRWVGEGE